MTIIQPSPATPADYDTTRLIERPDGFYWQLRHGGEEYGPFPTLLEAVRDMQYSDDNDTTSEDVLEAAESDIGIADWIDEETGEPGEDNAPRLDEH